MTATATQTIHKFEQAGLGLAPFRCVGVEMRRYKASPESPSQPGGTCDYCGEAIVECCIIRDAQAKTFIVGNVCVGKTGDTGLIDPIKRELNKIRTQERHQREAARIEAAKALLTYEVCELLESNPSPNAWRAENGETLLDHVRWMLQNAGNKGMVEASKIIEQAAKGEIKRGDDAMAQIRREAAAKEEAKKTEQATRTSRITEFRVGCIASEFQQDLIHMLASNTYSDFAQSMAEQLRHVAVIELSGGQSRVVEDIYGKAFGRYDSRKYWDALKAFDAELDAQRALYFDKVGERYS